MKSFWSILLAFILTASIGVGIFFGVKYKTNIKDYFSNLVSSSETEEEIVDYEEKYNDLVESLDGLSVTKVESYESIVLSTSDDSVTLGILLNCEQVVSYDYILIYQTFADTESGTYAYDNEISCNTKYTLNKDNNYSSVDFTLNTITFDSVCVNLVDVANIGDYSNFDTFNIETTYTITDNICYITINIMGAQ